MTGKRSRSVTALNEMIDESRLLFHRLRRVAETLHRQGELTGGRRGVLRSLYQSGPQTVPQLARARPVSRQHIQSLVNPLEAEGYVEFRDNPAHRRSNLVALTDKGRELVATMLEREEQLLGLLAENFEVENLEVAVAEMRRLRAILSERALEEATERLAE